ncbi:MAG: Tex-like N-terminal domain-containing protein, partial [Burkholderiales bacterium]
MLLDLNIRLANALGIKESQVINTVKLIDEGTTVPFIARYRKEITSGLSDTQLRELVEQLSYMRELDERRATILKTIAEQGKLTLELEQSLLIADNKTTLEDLYLPYKPKRRTKAQIAKEAGLEPLALALLGNPDLIPETEAEKYINPELNLPDSKAALDGARYILIEMFAENAEVLANLRQKLCHEGWVATKVIEGKQE